MLTFPQHETFGLTDQMRRASKSVGALIAEGWGLRQSEKEFKNYLRRSLGSANEMEAHVETARELEYIPETTAKQLGDDYHGLGGQIVQLARNWRTYDRSPSSIVHPPSSARTKPTERGAK